MIFMFRLCKSSSVPFNLSFSTSATTCTSPCPCSRPCGAFHDLRHVHASLMLYFGHDIKEISERLGHAKSSFTYDTYVHIMSKTKKKLIDNLQRSIKL
ncbi:tyrosine-type recombinase/integrase [Bacillus velezensis]|uniref:tyrosine-type recombinase/integrase n=1 Tax=Bacillus velezensis TaxID=492670 RepID=UPI003F6A8E60